ncbi:hypothetical protein Asppvi_000438 [Aspergillus pseudoviridinutans]|uniref:Uncharacterized protein n=1 Tax=Aspergillus pseudoviridinutans TaxID=1517512 RepID=A0A9P3B2A1_9EURO|nr:uncharacterized protein Asppvi_000438 [Aspergillus pseudoviridinutans]GIJ81935.1 hypothetical protein Asppvi_000438 [Aspergillus pseudoviridinutans]
MLFNLGWTADAAAAHENDLVAPSSESRLSSPAPHPSPTISFPTLSSLGLADLYHRYKPTETNQSHQAPLRTMPLSQVESISSSDDNYTIVAPVADRPPISRAHSVRKQSSRPKSIYQLAHPAAHARHRRLKFRPKLLLQLQRVSQTPRPLPVLDVLPSTVFLPRLARKFPTIFKGKKGLGPNDLIVVTSDLYERTVGDIADKYLSSDEESQDNREVIATICQILREDALSQGRAEICLSSGPAWEAIPLPNGSYEFRAQTDHGVQVLRWVSRGAKSSRRVSAPPGGSLHEDGKRFTFSVINRNTRRHPVIASMTRNVLEVFDEYSMPSDPTLSPTCGMSVVSDSSELDMPLDQEVIKTDDGLRTIIILTAIWVAFREGWSQSFTYDDSALMLNPKGLCSPGVSRQSSPTAVRPPDDFLSEQRDTYLDRSVLNKIAHRSSTSSTFPLQTPGPSERARSMKYASLPKRSRSTGAAFIERSNRRSASGLETQHNRHSMFPAAHELGNTDATETHTAGGSSRHKIGDFTTSDGPDTAPDKSTDTKRRSRKHSTASSEKASKLLETRAVESAPSKGKRRHRLSGFFDFFTKKSGHH